VIHVHFHLAVSRDNLRAPFAAFLGSLRMKRKLSELDLQPILVFKFLDTPGDEIAPGSDEVGKNFEN
jgi:hypothetical protein